MSVGGIDNNEVLQDPESIAQLRHGQDLYLDILKIPKGRDIVAEIMSNSLDPAKDSCWLFVVMNDDVARVSASDPDLLGHVFALGGRGSWRLMQSPSGDQWRS